MEPRWKTYYPAARVRGCIIFDIFFHSSAFCFQHLQNMTLSLPEEIAFCPPPLSLAVITSGVKEVTWTHCTGCGKRSVGLHIRLRPTGPFQSNNTLYQNCIPKVIYTTTSLTDKQYVLCQIKSRGAEERVFRSGIRHLKGLVGVCRLLWLLLQSKKDWNA